MSFFLYSAAVRQGIVDTVKQALSDATVKSVVICGQNGVFCGGMDKTIETQNHIRCFSVPLRCKMSSVCPFDGDKAEEKCLKMTQLHDIQCVPYCTLSY